MVIVSTEIRSVRVTKAFGATADTGHFSYFVGQHKDQVKLLYIRTVATIYRFFANAVTNIAECPSPDQKYQETRPTKEVSVMAWVEDAEQKVLIRAPSCGIEALDSPGWQGEAR